MERVGPEIDANTNLNIVNKEVLEWAAKRKNEIEDLKKLEKYRKNFLGNISHELKTPLFSIQGYLHTLLDGGLEDESINRRYIEKAVSNAERLQFIIDDLEIINKLEEDSKLDKTEFNLKRLIEEVIGDLEIVSKEKSIKLVLQKTR
ncbi:MAG: histidine kinase dimerization/phospho-acceptor domain-containing protein, partial [Saprospiraceae bacterium]|nr:histidine kinase dimerization/phospho-acceptor domain-containing protein [Saprospiraceae bacterium]